MVTVQHPFKPVFSCDSRILILGSFPSVKSREQQFYYGHPQNRFWQLLARIYQVSLPKTIDEKRNLILDHGLALWDVIGTCQLKGSSDASIRNAMPVDIGEITQNAFITAVLCNGALAGKLYTRFLLHQTGIHAEVLPSTSPANAAWSLDRLYIRWKESIDEALQN